jgi:hypothetical protein
MEEFMAPFGKSRTKYRGRYELRPVKKVYPNALTDVISGGDSLENEFYRFATQHAQQWEAEGKPGHFGDWPDGLSYNRDLVEAHGALGRMRFTRIRVEDRVIASQYIFSFGGCYYWELPSREIAPEYSDFRLGSTASLTMIGTAITEGITRIEAGLGHYPYKLELGAKEHPVVVFQIHKTTFLSQVRKSISDLIKQFVAYGYNRIWYRRIQPHLPKSYRSHQWKICLRFDY